MNRPPDSQISPAKLNSPLRAPWARWANWIVGLIAAVLLSVSVGAYWWHQRQLHEMTADHLRLVVAGPSTIQAGASARYLVSTTAITGDPIPAEIKFSVGAPKGGTPFVRNERCGDEGRLQVVVPAEHIVAPGVRLEVLAGSGDAKHERADIPLAVEPTRHITQLTCDKVTCRPGEKVAYRTLTLTRFGMTVDREMPIAFEVHDSQGAVVPKSAQQATTKRGIAKGTFAVPADLPDGQYVLIARSPESAFPEVKQVLAISDPAARRPEPAAKPVNPESSDAIRDGAERIDVEFYPEGGYLVAGMENRVYFLARDARGKAVSLNGAIVDQNGDEISLVETSHDGRGTFRLVPRADQQYRLKVHRPANSLAQPQLPAILSESIATLSTGTGVFEAGAPLEFAVRAAQAGLPLVITATCRGVLVGTQTVVTNLDENGTNPVVIALDDTVAGVLRLTVYDCRAETLKPLAERLVFRRPGKPIGALTGVKGKPFFAGGSRDAAAYFLLGAEIENPHDLVDAAEYLSEDAQSTLALDLLLGTQGWRRFAAETYEGLKRENRSNERLARLVAMDGAGPPPAMFDNLGAIRGLYQESLSAYEARWARMLSVATTVSFFGGLGLVLMVTMLGLLRVVSGVHLWVPAVGVTLCCLVIGMILMDPAGLHTSLDAEVPFRPCPAEVLKDPKVDPKARFADAKQDRSSDRQRIPSR